MFLISLYLFLLVIIIFFVLTHKREPFSLEKPEIISNSTTSVIHIDDMDTIDYSVSKLEKIKRDEKSNELNECISKYVNRPVKAFRDVEEIMSSQPRECDNIYDYTRVGGSYFNQKGYW
tara:strand:- start:762 stop:1118 length:357 start_codon:yes stop_codon:yes gene_type:complete